MIPYGIIIKQNRLVMQQSLMVWQRKFGLLNPVKFILSAIPLLCIFACIFSAASFLFEKEFSLFVFFGDLVMNLGILALLMFFSAVKTVREYAATAKEEKIQLVLTQEALEITTEFTKETVPYSEIDSCFEKDFLLTVISDKNNFPVSVSKMHVEKGSYDVFVSLLKSRIPDRYEKRGEN